MRKEADDTGPLAELEHWRQLNSRFSSILEQIKGHDCRMIINVLHIAKSKVIKVSCVNCFRVHLHFVEVKWILWTFNMLNILSADNEQKICRFNVHSRAVLIL